MDRKYGPPRLFLGILALLLLPCAGWSKPQVAADATYAKKIEAMMPPKVECILSSPNVITGQSVTVTARAQAASAGLVYSFSSNGGRLYPDGSTARLDTTGLPAGRAISVTCEVTNGLGEKGSGGVIVHVVAKPSIKTAGHGTIVGSAEMAAKNNIEGNFGAPRGGTQHHASHEYATQAAQSAEAQAAPAQQAEAHEGVVEPAPPPVAVAPAPHVPAAAAAAPAPPPPTTGAIDPYQGSEVRAQWVKALKNGKIEYLIPEQMKLHETSVVTVIVHGFADMSQNSLTGAKNGTLKVSPYMRVQLTADNPDEFEIDPRAGAVLPVPIDSSAKWTWNVKPTQPAKDQKLTIEAFLVYSEKGDNPQELLPSYFATVSVSVPGVWESLREDFWNDPAAAIKYVLPGGAGFTVAAGLIVWWWKRKHPSEDKSNKED